jgi:CYTH domain-containing protein
MNAARFSSAYPGTQVCAVLGEPIPVEIERKFLCEATSYPGHESEIIQTYLISEPGVERRVRQRGCNGNYSYYYTEKRPMENSSRGEVERMISQKEYLTLLMQADTNLNQIRKDRTCFLYKDKYFELDHYPWSDKCILEIELSSETEEFEIPPEIKVIKETTEDPHYKNYNLAKTMYL